MRILPPPWEGLHPAFPVAEPPYTSHPVVTSAFYASLAGFATSSISKLLLRRVSGLPVKTTAYSFVCFASFATFTNLLRGVEAKTFLLQQGIEVPKARPFDRIGYFDVDDAALVSAGAAIVFASRLSKPWAVAGWRRWVAAAAWGGTLGSYTYVLYPSWHNGIDAELQRFQRMKEDQERAKEWRPQVRAAIAQRIENAKPRLETRVPPRSPPLTASRMLQPSNQPIASQPGIPAEVPAGEKIGFGPQRWSNHSNEPHLTDKPTPASDPVPYANTNYLWTPKPGREIEELEVHIAKLRRRRQEYAAESELLWRWLADKEVDYYNFKGPSNSDEAVKKRRYVEVLGNIHTKVWAEASKCDWMIADSQKRIEQIRSKETNETKNVTWLPPLSKTAATTEPRMWTTLLQNHYDFVKHWKQSADEVIAELVNASLDEEERKEKTQSLLSGKMITREESLRELIKRMEVERVSAQLDEEVLREVVEDVEQKARDAKKKAG